MDAEFLARSAATDSDAPAGLDDGLRVLWLAKAGRWEEAHDQCQDLPDPSGAWIHAWLHREEGDRANAAYWYARARKPLPPHDLPLAEEWLRITTDFLSRR